MATQITFTGLTTEEFESLVSACVLKAILNSFNSLPPKNELENSILTRQETAKLLSISLPTLHDYTKRGLIKAHRLGSKVRYKREDLEIALKHIRISIK
ncbi:helix-turn-helix domain-containing protein [Mucilaginibacter corticis]|uniref:Helix-turn-helix domain-containing protein n=1 Tax=Mucilaginibacter corticis TaxID=2597670 RepID=A0A556MJY8_9SPHI|nr:helix-turn-helix domain-containing protein [Mucilaginibacter corticis]TSJ40221.1 helix-turn-helix domain-containing protein [Mucilaginibacter corticis]